MSVRKIAVPWLLNKQPYIFRNLLYQSECTRLITGFEKANSKEITGMFGLFFHDMLYQRLAFNGGLPNGASFVCPEMKLRRFVSGEGLRPCVHKSFDFDKDNRALMTLIIHLNDNYEGGKMAFPRVDKRSVCSIGGFQGDITNKAHEQRNGEIKDNEEEEMEVSLEAGSGLIFSHGILHKIQEVTSGTKYCLQTDILFPKDIP